MAMTFKRITFPYRLTLKIESSRFMYKRQKAFLERTRLYIAFVSRNASRAVKPIWMANDDAFPFHHAAPATRHVNVCEYLFNIFQSRVDGQPIREVFMFIGVIIVFDFGRQSSSASCAQHLTWCDEQLNINQLRMLFTWQWV